MNQNETVTLVGGAVHLENQPPQTVMMIKLIDKSTPEAAPTVTAQAPAAVITGETITVSARKATRFAKILVRRYAFELFKTLERRS